MAMKAQAVEAAVPEGFGVTSLEKGRVTIIEENETLLISKKTAKKELNNLLKVQRWLQGRNALTGKKANWRITVAVPKIIEWRDLERTLIMEYCIGDNLETELMKNDENRGLYIDLLSDLLGWMRENAFYWQGFAPRNLLFNRKDNTVTLIDFESNLRLGRSRMSDADFSLFVQDTIILELATILFPEEQNYLLPDVWKHCRRMSIPVEKVIGRRRRQYLLSKHPHASEIKHEDLVALEKDIVAVASPFLHEGGIYYPLIALSEISSVDRYVRTVCELQRRERRLWPNLIERAISQGA